MPKRTRERQLAKLAARRQAEKRALQRRRNLIRGLIGGIAALVLIMVAAAVLLNRSNSPAQAASKSPTASASSSVQPSPCGSPTPPPSAGKTKPQFKSAPEVTIDPSKTYTATIKTSCGTFSVDLFSKTATDSVNNFVFLADKGFYDGLVFHRIVSDFVIQGGDPKGDGTGGPGYDLPVTVTPGASFDAAGVVAYAHASTGGNGSQFFVTLGAQPSLDPPQGKYTIFGTVKKGLDVVQKIGSVPTVPGPDGSPSSPSEPIFIESIKITTS